MIIVDGISYPIGVSSLRRHAKFEPKFEAMTEDGKWHVENIGTYYNFSITFEPAMMKTDEYMAFYNVITSPNCVHEITVPTGNNDTYSFRAKFSNIEDSLVYITPNLTYWTGLTIEFSAMEPARTP